MKDLEPRSYYNLKTPEQWSLYDIADDAQMWHKITGRLAVIFLVAFVLMTYCYSSERGKREDEVRQANERVLTMVEQLKRQQTTYDH